MRLRGSDTFDSMTMKIQLAIILLAVSAVFSEDNRYCLLESCPNGSHTLCKFKEAGPAESCETVTAKELTQKEKDDLLSLHNSMRKYPYIHEGSSDTQSTETDFIPLEWDDELAKSAQRWAEQCKNETDTCRNDYRFEVSQRVGLYDVPKYLNRNPPVFRAVGDWYQQEESNRKNLKNSWSLAKIFGLGEIISGVSNELAPKVWGKATKLGCGALRTEDVTKNYLRIACNFAPKD